MVQSSESSLPAAYVQERLERNLAALEALRPELAARVRAPVGSEHVHFNALGEAFFRIHDSSYRLELPVERVESLRASARGAERALIFGLGTGELTDALLESRGPERVVAWERDPWLLRLALLRYDWSHLLRSRRLELRLGIDLLELAPLARHDDPWRLVEHPFLVQVYREERQLLESGAGSKRALLVAGGLFVPQLARQLRARGYALYTAEIAKLSMEELSHTCRRFDPDFVLAVNYTRGLAEFCASEQRALVCWEIDPTTDRPTHPQASEPKDAPWLLFSYRRANLDGWKQAGFTRARWLPLAADTEARVPVALEGEDLQRYAAPIAFVGSSMVRQAQRLEARFLDLWRAWRGQAPEAGAEAQQLLRALLLEQRSNFERYRLPELMEQRCGDFLRAARALPRVEDPLALVAEMSAAEKRLSWAAALGPYGLRVWGDSGWKLAEKAGVKVMGSAGHEHELNKVYSGAMINLDIGRLYQSDIVSMRVFDVLACGGFALVERSEDLPRLFAERQELAAYSTRKELVEQARYYFDRPREAQELAQRGRAAVLARHTLSQRVDHLLAALEGLRGMQPAVAGEDWTPSED